MDHRNHVHLRPPLLFGGIVLSTLLCAAFVICGCKKQSPAQNMEPQTSSAARPQPAQDSQSTKVAPVPVQSPSAYETDPIYQLAQTQAKTDLQKAFITLETAITKAPDDPHSAPYYLLLGRLKKEYEDYPGYFAGSPERTKKNIEEFEAYAQAHPTEYFHDEPSGEFLYNGIHFKELVKRFPASPLAVEAAYEETNVSQGGECESDIVCPIEGGFAPVRDFLLLYPDSPYSEEAAKRADAAFRDSLWGAHWKTYNLEITDTTKATDDYNPEQLKKLVQQYEELAEKMPAKFRPRIYETTAYYHARLHETDRARELYNCILQQTPDYENIAEVRKALNELP